MTASTKRMVLNTRERVVSNDHNRLQAFESAALTDALRFLYDARSTEDDGGGLTTTGLVQTNPLRAVILSGCRFRPEIGTVNAFITEGALVMVDPESPASADDSAAKLIVDPGITVSGQLTLTAGAGSTRIDVVECAKVDEVLETQNVDVFNPATGLFSPVSQTKVARQRLQWRIRTGTPGAGFPGTAQGWLPVAVCVVPTSAATWDVVDVYDVRPLVADFRRTQNVAVNYPRIQKSWASLVRSGGPPITSQKLRGIVETEWQGRIVGGDFASPTYNGGAASNFVDIKANASSFLAAGVTVTTSTQYFFYFGFPFGLPRWCKYSAAATGQRSPGAGPRGLLVISDTPPQKALGLNGTTIAIPTGTQLGGNLAAGEAVCFGSSWARDLGAGDIEISNFAINRGLVSLCDGAKLKNPSSGANTNTPGFQIIDQTDMPPGVVEVLVRFKSTVTATAAQTGMMQVVVDGPVIGWQAITRRVAYAIAAGTSEIQEDYWIPLDADSIDANGGGIHGVNFTLTFPGASAWSSQSMTLLAYRYGG